MGGGVGGVPTRGVNGRLSTGSVGKSPSFTNLPGVLGATP